VRRLGIWRFSRGHCTRRAPAGPGFSSASATLRPPQSLALRVGSASLTGSRTQVSFCSRKVSPFVPAPTARNGKSFRLYGAQWIPPMLICRPLVERTNCAPACAAACCRCRTPGLYQSASKLRALATSVIYDHEVSYFINTSLQRGYEFCQRGALKHSGRSCRTDGDGGTVRTCWSANQQVGSREMLGKKHRSHSPF